MNAELSSWAPWLALGWTMLHYLWVGALIGLAALAARRLASRLAPELRYAVAVASFALLAVAPVVIACLVYDSRSTAAPQLSTAAAPEPVVKYAPPLAGYTQPPAASVRPQQPAVSPSTGLLARRTFTQVAAIAPWVWVCGAPLTLALLAAGLVGTERIRRGCRPLVDAAALASCRAWSASLGVGREVTLAVSDRVVAPLLLGVVRPLIVLPASALAGWSPEQLEMILLHELAHVRRHDNLVNLVQRLVESLLFFHPAVWIVSGWVRLEREHCCDAVVLAHTSQPQAYAETLAALAMPGLAPAHAAAVMANHQLVGRIRHILNLEERGMCISKRMLGAAVAAAALTIVSIAAWSNRSDAQDAGQEADKGRAAREVDLKVKLAALREVYLTLTGAVPPELEALSRQAPSDAPQVGSVGVALNGDVGLVGTIGSGQAPQTVGDGFYVADVDNDGQVDIHVTGTTSFLGLSTNNKRAWGPEQATGAPDSPTAGDQTTAWASATQDGSPEWLALTYAEPVDVVSVLVYENYNPGALVGIDAAEEGGSMRSVWTGEDPTKTDASKGISVVPLSGIMTRSIVLHLDSQKARGWNEIDAVGLLDASGKVHWATSAQASSTYAQPSERLDTPQFPNPQFNEINFVTSAAGTQAAPRPWSAEQATEAPNVPTVGDSQAAWASLSEDGQEEWLDLTFANAVQAGSILVYESFNPGAVRDVVISDEAGKEYIAMFNRPKESERSFGLMLPLDGKRRVKRVRLIIDSANKPGWNEIDAVGLLDVTTGQVQWASEAEASSSYANRQQVSIDFSNTAFSVLALEQAGAAAHACEGFAMWKKSPHVNPNQMQCASCHQGVHGVTSINAQPQYDLNAAANDRLRELKSIRSALTRLEKQLAHDAARGPMTGGMSTAAQPQQQPPGNPIAAPQQFRVQSPLGLRHSVPAENAAVLEAYPAKEAELQALVEQQRREIAELKKLLVELRAMMPGLTPPTGLSPSPAKPGAAPPTGLPPGTVPGSGATAPPVPVPSGGSAVRVVVPSLGPVPLGIPGIGAPAPAATPGGFAPAPLPAPATVPGGFAPAPLPAPVGPPAVPGTAPQK